MLLLHIFNLFALKVSQNIQKKICNLKLSVMLLDIQEIKIKKSGISMAIKLFKIQNFAFIQIKLYMAKF